MKTFSFLIFATLPLWPVAAAAQLNVLISGGFSNAYEQLLPEFERTSGIKVATGSGASQGTGPQTIAAQLARGVPADVVILSREGLGELIAANRIAAGTDVDLARVPLGVAVPAGTAKLDVTLRSRLSNKPCLRPKSSRCPRVPAASGCKPIFFRDSASRKRLPSKRRRAALTQPNWSLRDARIWPSCRSVKFCTRRGSSPERTGSPAAGCL